MAEPNFKLRKRIAIACVLGSLPVALFVAARSEGPDRFLAYYFAFLGFPIAGFAVGAVLAVSIDHSLQFHWAALRRWKWNRWTISSLILVGALIWSVWNAYARQAAYANSVGQYSGRVEGSVQNYTNFWEFRTGPHNSESRATANVDTEYSVQDILYKKFGSVNHHVSDNSFVTVYFDPHNPGDAHLEGDLQWHGMQDADRYLHPLGLICCGCLPALAVLAHYLWRSARG